MADTPVRILPLVVSTAISPAWFFLILDDIGPD